VSKRPQIILSALSGHARKYFTKQLVSFAWIFVSPSLANQRCPSLNSMVQFFVLFADILAEDCRVTFSLSFEFQAKWLVAEPTIQ
jgi:hypothetical protein